MRRRDFLVSLSLFLVGPGLLAACRTGEPLKIGIHPWPGYEQLQLADHFGWLPEQVMLNQGNNAGDSLAGLMSGRLDGACLTLDEVLVAHEKGMELTIILVFNESVGADAVVAASGINSIAELQGKRIAVEETAVGGLVLAQLLESSGLQRDELVIVPIPPDQQLEAWRGGNIDAAVTYEPTTSLLQKAGARRLFDSRQFPGLIYDVLAVRTDRLRKHKNNLQGLVAAHFQALEHLRRHREDTMRRVGYWRNLSYQAVEKSYAGLNLPTVVANWQMLGADGSLLSSAHTLAEVMLTSGLLKHQPDLKGLTTSAYLPRENNR